MISKQAKAGVGKRGGEGSRIDKGLQRSLLEEAAIEVQDHAHKPDADRDPTDEIPEVTPQGGVAPPFPAQECHEQDGGCGQREVERQVFCGVVELVDGVSEVDIQAEQGQVHKDEDLDPEPVIQGPLTAVWHGSSGVPRPSP
jgi:hypothetical protein